MHNENESDAIRNLFDPNIILELPSNAMQTEVVAFHVAWAIHSDVMGGDFIVTKTPTDTNKIYLTEVTTGTRYIVTVTKESISSLVD
jgi:hypothetical protein